MSPDAGKAAMGGPAENEGTKGYASDDAPLRDGHNQEPDMPETAGAGQSSVAIERPGPAGADVE